MSIQQLFQTAVAAGATGFDLAIEGGGYKALFDAGPLRVGEHAVAAEVAAELMAFASQAHRSAVLPDRSTLRYQVGRLGEREARVIFFPQHAH